LLLLIGTILASVIGTTGASMLLIRPLLRANSERKDRVHIVIFLIFLVANIGGCLTPIGDPPLFLGFLRGVPFFWTLQMFPILLLNAGLLLTIFYFYDRWKYRRELAEATAATASSDSETLLLETELDSGDEILIEFQDQSAQDHKVRERLSIKGIHNFGFVALIVGAVVSSGYVAQSGLLTNPETGEQLGIPLPLGVSLEVTTLAQMLIILAAGLLSRKFTAPEIYQSHNFNFAPIQEVAELFIGIFITMIPALELLKTYGANLGLSNPAQFFWSSGLLSSFLDNAPTYLVFAQTAAALPPGTAEPLALTIGNVAPGLLLAISAGSVFMGAMTYIGNAPNFMVANIAKSDGIKMPSFFGYISYSARFLLPVFLLDTLIFWL
jgi:Na+/H+ antiporter NhaD/arsenite permease-like protein